MTITTLFDWPASTSESSAGRIEVIGVPSDCGNGIASGARLGPSAIRKASIGLRPEAIGVDRGDVGHVHGADWEQVLREVEGAVAAIIRRDARPLLLGGDHSISYAAVAGARAVGPLNVVWFDAHTDFCSWTPGGWHDHKQVLRRIAGLDHVGRIVQIGHRGITYFDEAARYDRLSVVSATDAATMSSEILLARLPPHEPIYMSIDIDSLDPQWAPGTGHPVPGGLTLTQLIRLTRAIAEKRRLIGVDLMEVNPLLDVGETSSAAAVAVVAAIVPLLWKGSGAPDAARSCSGATVQMQSDGGGR